MLLTQLQFALVIMTLLLVLLVLPMHLMLHKFQLFLLRFATVIKQIFSLHTLSLLPLNSLLQHLLLTDYRKEIVVRGIVAEDPPSAVAARLSNAARSRRARGGRFLRCQP